MGISMASGVRRSSVSTESRFTISLPPFNSTCAGTFCESLYSLEVTRQSDRPESCRAVDKLLSRQSRVRIKQGVSIPIHSYGPVQDGLFMANQQELMENRPKRGTYQVLMQLQHTVEAALHNFSGTCSLLRLYTQPKGRVQLFQDL